MGILSFLFLFSLSLHAEVIVNQQLNSFIESFGVVSPKVIIPFSNCSLDEAPAVEPQNQFENDLNQFGFQKVSCPNPWSDQAFYRQINTKYCASRFGDMGFTCVENDKLKIEARVANVDLIDKIESFTIKRFSERKILCFSWPF